jgi:hypothetical protein
MENVQFEENLEIKSFDRRQSEAGSISKLIKKLGLAKNQKQTNIVMILVTVICFIITFYFVMSAYFPDVISLNRPGPTKIESPAQIKSDMFTNRNKSNQ